MTLDTMKKLAYILSGTVFFLAVSCDLTENPKDMASTDMVFGSETGLQNYTYGFYNWLPGWGDAFRINITMDNAAKIQTDTYEVGAYTTNSETSWDWSSIRNVNYFIQHNTDERVPENVRNNYTGIARLFRAYFYFDKLVKYGEVPWIDKVLEPESEELYKAQDSRDVIISNIIADLDYAYRNITETGITPNSNTVNKWTALFYKSRFCLFEASFRKYHSDGGSEFGDEYLKGCTITADELFAEAAEAAELIMNQGPYRLHTAAEAYTGDGRGAYRDLFISDKTVTEEVMLALSLDPVLQMGTANWWYNSSSYGVHLCMTRAFAKTYLNLDGTFYNERNEDGTYKTFDEETAGRDYRLNQTIRAVDYTSLGTSGKYVPTAPNIVGLAETGYQFTKYVMDDPSMDNGPTNYNDIPYARYAEVLLNYAEAKAELGTLTDEQWSRTIGALRRRAGITGGDLDIKPTVADPYMQSIYPDVTDPVILEIRRERECELVLEGLRLNDLKRWACGHLWQDAPWDGIYIPAMDTPLDLNGDGVYDVYFTQDQAYNGQYAGIAKKSSSSNVFIDAENDPDDGYILTYNASRIWNDNMYIYPVPEVVIQKNGNLHQNPGWN